MEYEPLVAAYQAALQDQKAKDDAVDALGKEHQRLMEAAYAARGVTQTAYRAMMDAIAPGRDVIERRLV